MAQHRLRDIWQIQKFLWEVWDGRLATSTSGIPAFPSVHVSAMAVGALYLAERVRWFAPLSVFGVLIILFYSVYSGYYYAIVGYFPILVVGLMWWFGFRRQYRNPV